MTQYLLAVYDVPGSRETGTENSRYAGEAELAAAFQRVNAFNEELRSAGAWVFAGGLAEPAAAIVVDNTTGAAQRSDGPLPKADELLGGVWVIEAADIDAALAWAAKGSTACGAPVEVRAFQG